MLGTIRLKGTQKTQSLESILPPPGFQPNSRNLATLANMRIAAQNAKIMNDILRESDETERMWIR